MTKAMTFIEWLIANYKPDTHLSLLLTALQKYSGANNKDAIIKYLKAQQYDSEMIVIARDLWKRYEQRRIKK